MAATQGFASLIALMAVAVTVFSLIGGSLAADSPAPSPTSSAGGVSPSFTVGCVATFVAFLFGSMLKI
ncbi:hypothetical protein NMG60_11000798 [Bertholletia excelsa]